MSLRGRTSRPIHLPALLLLALAAPASALAQSITLIADRPSTPTAATQPAAALQPRPRYTLVPGDILDLVYRFTPQFNQTVAVLPDGFVTLDLVGSLRVSGLTLDQVHDLILAHAAAQLNAPDLTLSLKEFQQPSITVAGEVFKPGKLPFREGETALQAILQSGGFGENARAGEVLLFRRVDSDNAEIKVLKLDSFKKRADLRRDLALQPGDMLLVPRDRVFILSRYIKLTNVGFYFNPLQGIP